MSENKKYNSDSIGFGFDFYPKAQNTENLEIKSSQASCCVLVKTDYLQDENKRFVEKVLSSIQLKPENDYSIVCLKAPIPFVKIKEKFPELQLLIAFGHSPRELELQTHNELNRWIYLNNIQLIFTQKVEDLQPDPDLKVKFWDQLKKYVNSKK